MRVLKFLCVPAIALSMALSLGCGGNTEPEVLNEDGVTAEDIAEMEAYEAEQEQYEEEYEE